MPFVLDYDGDGNVAGGHYVEEFPDRSSRLLTSHVKLDPPTSKHNQGPPNSSVAVGPNIIITMSRPTGQAPPDGSPPGPPFAPAAYRRSNQARRLPDLVTTARYSQHASNADLHPYLQQSGPSTHQVAPYVRQHLDHHQTHRFQRQRALQQPTIHHPQPQRAVIGGPERSLFSSFHQPHIDNDGRIAFVPAPSAPAATSSQNSGAWQTGDKRVPVPSAVTVPTAPSQRLTTYPVSVPNKSIRGPLSEEHPQVVVPEFASNGPARKPPLQQGSPLTISASLPTVPTLQHTPPRHPPVTIPAPPGGIKNYAKAKDFVNRFAAHFGQGSNECTLFEHLAVGYNRKEVSRVDFYAGVYRILLYNNSLALLSGFMDFFSDSWDTKHLSCVSSAVERDLKEQAEAKGQGRGIRSVAGSDPASNELQQEHELAVVDEPLGAQIQPIAKPAPKKKRPINGFSTQHREDGDGTIDPAVFKPAHYPPMSSVSDSARVAQSQGEASMAKAEHRSVTDEAVVSTPEHCTPLDPVKLKLKGNPKPPMKGTPSSSSSNAGPANRPQRAASISATKKRKATEELDTQAGTPNGSNHYGDTPAAEVEHCGPIYPTRRSVLHRDSRPYIHLACGSRFAHPGDVKAHARKGNQGKGCGDLEKWNEHQSCQADYIHIRYARVKDGFVILNQKSYDKLESAVQAGLAHARDHPQQEMQTTGPPVNKPKKVSKKKTSTRKMTTTKKQKAPRKSNFPPPADGPEQLTKYEFEFDTEGDADAEGEDDPDAVENESKLSASLKAPPAVSEVVKAPPAHIPNAEQQESKGEVVAQPPEPEFEWDGTALRAAALGLRKRPRL
ncbi:hypothetical protein DOTSEDRAFT_22303 [Dothistroma septosporum NZE10]|uniref:Uncharacterized protein n=1 Tax=Dothistroma septosporum (strain NZE10 / CBS 128990) TaxID=675120 RepID=N1PRW3_DOTSN|nr:hypothetical protein DOTSEDRAFT_22303 [Dothistroma septosporum NZE10]